MTLDERIEALTMNLELAARDIEHLKTLAARDGEHIRALVRVAELHHERLSRLEDQQ